MKLRHMDVTLARYLDTSASVVLQVLVLIAVLGVLGVETTSFAALPGGRWHCNWRRMVRSPVELCRRPFPSDVPAVQGRRHDRRRRDHGEVREIGLFVTSIDTADHVLTFVGNNKLFSDNVQNFSANAYRRVDLTVQLPPDARRRADDRAAAEGARIDSARPGRPRAERRDSHRQPRGQRPRSPPVLPQRPLLACLFRDQPRDRPSTKTRGHSFESRLITDRSQDRRRSD